MGIGFIIWSLITLILVGIGIWAWNAKEAAGFFAGIKPPKVKDIKKYNSSVASAIALQTRYILSSKAASALFPLKKNTIVLLCAGF